MGDNTKSQMLLVKYGDTSIGQLKLDNATGLLTLEYNEFWQQNGFAISPWLTLNNNHARSVAYNFVDNLLPEGHARLLLAENIGVSERNVYSQVRQIGGDLSGAITFNPSEAGQAFTTMKSPVFRPLSDEELEKRLDIKEDFGLLTWDDKPRLSVAGVQDKLNVFINDKGQPGFGDGALCSTHILKFEKQNCPNLVLNEYFCMKLSLAAELPTSAVKFNRIGKHPVLIVERYDRKYIADQQRVLRRHVIDGCQALNLPREFKYERNLGDGRDVKHIRDGASLPRLFAICRSMTSPVESTHWLLNWQLFNLLISNYDSHGKNISFFLDKHTFQFTPAYDLVNIAMFPQFKHVLAMAMGDEFEPDDIHAYQLADFAESCEIDKKLVSRSLTTITKKVITLLTGDAFINTLKDENDFTNDELNYMNQIKEHIHSKAAYLQSQAALIPSITI